MAETTEPMSALIERLEMWRGGITIDGMTALTAEQVALAIAALQAGQEYVTVWQRMYLAEQADAEPDYADDSDPLVAELTAAWDALVRAYRKEIPNG